MRLTVTIDVSMLKLRVWVVLVASMVKTTSRRSGVSTKLDFSTRPFPDEDPAGTP